MGKTLIRELRNYEMVKSQTAILNDWLDNDNLLEKALPLDGRIQEFVEQIDSSKLTEQKRDVAGNSNITITSRTFDMDSRRFYLDLNENGPNDSNDPNGPNGQNGPIGQNRFIRMSETDCHGYQTNIFMAIPTAVEFQKYLESVVNFYKGLESKVIKNVP